MNHQTILCYILAVAEELRCSKFRAMCPERCTVFGAKKMVAYDGSQNIPKTPLLSLQHISEQWLTVKTSTSWITHAKVLWNLHEVYEDPWCSRGRGICADRCTWFPSKQVVALQSYHTVPLTRFTDTLVAMLCSQCDHAPFTVAIFRKPHLHIIKCILPPLETCWREDVTKANIVLYMYTWTPPPSLVIVLCGMMLSVHSANILSITEFSLSKSRS